jgi:S-DNA-T family DNA segregation ATPase FtsK/SpoIIIE
VHVTARGSALCQVAIAAPAGGPAPAGTGCRTEVRVRPLPARVDAAHLPAPVPATPAGGPVVAIGLGGDNAGPVEVDLSRPLLVVGPPGSGRTTVLQALAAGAGSAGLTVLALAPDRGDPSATTGPAAILVVDDLDELEACEPAATDALAARLASGHPPRLVAATTTAHAASAFRGPVPALVRAHRLLVLDLAEPGALDLLGTEGAWLVDPRRRPPGRAALRLGRDVVPVQLVAPP